MIRYEPTSIETKRTLLRFARPSDAEPMFRHWTSDPVVTEYLSWSPHKNVGASELFISLWNESPSSDLLDNEAITKSEVIHWVCELKELKEVIGSITLMSYHQGEASGEIGFCYGKSFWGQGIATEVLAAVINFAFSIGFTKLICRTRSENVACKRVLEKSHMNYKETKTVFWLKDHQHHQIDYYEIEHPASK